MRKTILILIIFLIGCNEEPIEENIVQELPSEPVIPEAVCGDQECTVTENKCTCPEDCGECKGLSDEVCYELSCIEGKCTDVMIEPCCGNNKCEQGEKYCIDCPDCNDYNKCTDDWFDPIDLECKNEKIQPCCGDGVCEEEENCNNCLDDCDCNIGLEDYPNFFRGKPVYIIVGAKAPSSDVIAGTEISSRLTIATPNSALDNEIANLENTNAIVIGTPCDNNKSAELLPYKRGCLEYLKPDQSLIKLFKTGEDTYAVLVFGYTPSLTRTTANRLAIGKDLEKTEMII